MTATSIPDMQVRDCRSRCRLPQRVAECVRWNAVELQIVPETDSTRNSLWRDSEPDSALPD